MDWSIGRSGMDSVWCPVLFAALAVSLCSSPALADRKFGKQLCSTFFYCFFPLTYQVFWVFCCFCFVNTLTGSVRGAKSSRVALFWLDL